MLSLYPMAQVPPRVTSRFFKKVGEEERDDKKPQFDIPNKKMIPSCRKHVGGKEERNNCDGNVVKKVDLDNLFSQFAYTGGSCRNLMMTRGDDKLSKNGLKSQALHPQSDKKVVNVAEKKRLLEDEDKQKRNEAVNLPSTRCSNLREEGGEQNEKVSSKREKAKSWKGNVKRGGGDDLKLKPRKSCLKNRAPKEIRWISRFFPKVSKEEENVIYKVRHKIRARSIKPVFVRHRFTAAEQRNEAYRRKTPCNTWKPPRSQYHLLQEDHAHDPWRVLVICMLLNQTTGLQVRRVLPKLFTLCPNASAATKVEAEHIEKVIKSLGFQTKRAEMIKRLSEEYLDESWTYVSELHGVGKYGCDAYAIFCTGKWDCVQPEDHILIPYWSFLRRICSTKS